MIAVRFTEEEGFFSTPQIGFDFNPESIRLHGVVLSTQTTPPLYNFYLYRVHQQG
jgi:hypothetical protein